MPPRTPRGARSADPTRRLLKSVERLAGAVDRLTSDLDKIRDEQRIQLKRIAQLQADLDAVKRAWGKMQAGE